MRLQQEVTAASRQAESIFDAPASVTVIPQEELRAFGFQTLWDALGGLRGIYQTNDRSYRSLGFRGFSQPQDYGNHLLVLTDGHVMNDDLLGSSYVGYDARSDLMDVERVEVVRGPGSALYGTNAFLGVINVVTRDRDTMMRPHASLASDGYRMGRLRVGGGHRFSRDAGFWASASGVLSQGQNLYLPGVATTPGRDDPRRGRLLRGERHGAAWVGDFTIEGSYNRRRKQIPTGAFDTIPAIRARRTPTAAGSWRSAGSRSCSPEVALSARVFLDYYEYAGDFPTDPVGARTSGGRRHPRSLARLLDRRRGPRHDQPGPLAARHHRRRGARLAGRRPLQPERRRRPLPRPHAALLRRSAPTLIGRSAADPTADPSQLGGRYDFVSTFANGAFSPRATIIVRPVGHRHHQADRRQRLPRPEHLRALLQRRRATQMAPASLSPERIWTGEARVHAAHRRGAERDRERLLQLHR